MTATNQLHRKDNVRKRFETCFFMKKFSLNHMQMCTAGSIFNMVLCDVITFIPVNKAVQSGQLPYFTIDVLVIVLSLLEAICSVAWSVIVQQRRHCLMTISALLPSLTSLIWIFVPSVDLPKSSELCSSVKQLSFLESGIPREAAVESGIDSGISREAAIILGAAVFAGLVNVVSRAALWNHAITTLEENKPQYFSLGYGLFITARVVGPWIFPKLFNDLNATFLIIMFVAQVLNVLNIYRMSITTNQYEKDGLGSGFWHVLSSKTVLGQIVSMALLASALWGYGIYENQIIKTRFLLLEERTFTINEFDILLLHVFIIIVILYGVLYSKPGKIFNQISAVKLSIGASIYAVALYLILGLAMTCNQGTVAGLDSNVNYSIPDCGQQCRCAALPSSFSPVCITDTAITYLSSCHAGCESYDVVSGHKMYGNCICAPASGLQRAMPGACSTFNCAAVYYLYRLLSAHLIVVTLIALQAQMASILKSVDPRDLALALGIATAITLIATFVCTHFTYTFFIGGATCAWSENNICQFHTSSLPKLVGVTSAVLAVISLIASIVIFIVLKAQNRREVQQSTPLEIVE